MFMTQIEEYTPQINVGFKEICESDLRLNEVVDADKALRKALWKSPSQAGLTIYFYEVFWEDIKELLFNDLKECIETNALLL